MEIHPTWKKENKSTEKEGFLYASLASNKENGNIESRILIGFAPYTMILCGCEEKIAVDQAVF